MLIVDFAASAITYRIRVWITDFAADDGVRDRVRSGVYYAFRRRGIEIPYPIQIHIDRGAATESGSVAAAERALRAVEIFAALSDEQHAEIARVARPQLYAAGEAIVREGESGSSMFVLTRGEVVVTVGAPGHEVARHGPGSFFGEMSLLTGAPRTATVTAVPDCEMLEITAEAFRRVVLANPAAVEQVGAAVATRALQLTRVPAGSSANNVAEPPATFIDRMWRFLHLSAPALLLALLCPGRLAAADAAVPHPPAPDGRRVVVAAVESCAPIAVDAVLDEEVWRTSIPCRLLCPHKHVRPSAVLRAEDQSRSSAFDVVQSEMDAIGVDVDAVVAQEQELLRGGQTEQPERNRDLNQLPGRALVGEHPHGLERRLPPGAGCDVAMQDRLVACPDLDERRLAREPGPCLRELFLGVLVVRELRVDVAANEERGPADRRDRKHEHHDHRGD